MKEYKFKRILAIVSVVTLSLASLAGCGQNNNDTNSEKQLNTENVSTESTTVGEEKPATAPLDQFAAAGFSYTGLNTTNPYTTECYWNTNHTTGTLTFVSYTRASKDDEYDTVTLTARFVMGDENARTGSSCAFYGIEDAYNYTDGQNNVGALYQGDRSCTFSVTYNGVVYDNCSAQAVLHASGEWIDGVGYDSTQDYIITIPKGYDGMVLWIAGYPGEDKELEACTHLSTLDSFYAFKCN